MSRIGTDANGAQASHKRPFAGRRVYVYIRVSKGREDMISPAVQEMQCRRAAEQQGLVVVQVVADLDHSGRDFVRRQVAWMIDGVRHGQADGVLVWKCSRWGRNFTESLQNLKALQTAGGVLISATEPFGEMHTPTGKFAIAQMLLIADLQSEQISESWKDAQENRRQHGLPADGQPRFGYIYSRTDRRYDVDPDSGSWLRWSYEAIVAGRPPGLVQSRRDGVAAG